MYIYSFKKSSAIGNILDIASAQALISGFDALASPQITGPSIPPT